MTKPNIKRKFFLSLALILIVWFIAGFLFQMVRSRIKKTEVLLSDINLQTSKKGEIKSLANQIEILNDKIKMADSFLLGSSQENLVGFIETLESISENAGTTLVIESIAVSKIDDEVLTDDFENLNLKLEAKGIWREIVHFMNMVGNLPYHMVIQRAALNLIPASSFENTNESVWKLIFEFTVTKVAN